MLKEAINIGKLHGNVCKNKQLRWTRYYFRTKSKPNVSGLPIQWSSTCISDNLVLLICDIQDSQVGVTQILIPCILMKTAKTWSEEFL